MSPASFPASPVFLNHFDQFYVVVVRDPSTLHLPSSLTPSTAASPSAYCSHSTTRPTTSRRFLSPAMTGRSSPRRRHSPRPSWSSYLLPRVRSRPHLPFSSQRTTRMIARCCSSRSRTPTRVVGPGEKGLEWSTCSQVTHV